MSIGAWTTREITFLRLNQCGKRISKRAIRVRPKPIFVYTTAHTRTVSRETIRNDKINKSNLCRIDLRRMVFELSVCRRRCPPTRIRRLPWHGPEQIKYLNPTREGEGEDTRVTAVRVCVCVPNKQGSRDDDDNCGKQHVATHRVHRASWAC